MLSTWKHFIRGLESRQNLDTQRRDRRRGQCGQWLEVGTRGERHTGVGVGCSKGWLERNSMHWNGYVANGGTCVSRGCHTGEGAQGKETWVQANQGVVTHILPRSFLCPPLSSAGSFVLFSGAAAQPWWIPQSSRPSGLRGLERSLISVGGNLCKVFTAGTQGGREPGLSADRGLWKEEGRGPGCLNSWGGSGCHSLTPLPSLAFRAQAPSYLGSDCNCPLMELCS